MSLTLTGVGGKLSKAAGGGGPVAFVSSVVGTINFTPALTVTSVAPSGSDRLLLVGIHWSDATATVGTVVFNTSESLTRLGGGIQGILHSDIWYLIAPSVTTASLVITMAGATSMGSLMAGANWLTGTHQTTPLTDFQSFGTVVNPGAQPTLTISSTTNDLVFDALMVESAPTIGAGQTLRYTTAGNSLESRGSTEPGAASVTMSWSAISNFSAYIHTACNIESS